jgi:hypothetical protein
MDGWIVPFSLLNNPCWALSNFMQKVSGITQLDLVLFIFLNASIKRIIFLWLLNLRLSNVMFFLQLWVNDILVNDCATVV